MPYEGLADHEATAIMFISVSQNNLQPYGAVDTLFGTHAALRTGKRSWPSKESSEELRW
jgi:hypothetical protein